MYKKYTKFVIYLFTYLWRVIHNIQVVHYLFNELNILVMMLREKVYKFEFVKEVSMRSCTVICNIIRNTTFK